MVPPIEQHPSQIRQRPVQKAQTQKNTATVESQNTNLIARANSSSQKRALETVVPGDGSPFKATAVSSVDGAKVSLRSSASRYVRQEITRRLQNYKIILRPPRIRTKIIRLIVMK